MLNCWLQPKHQNITVPINNCIWHHISYTCQNAIRTACRTLRFFSHQTPVSARACIVWCRIYHFVPKIIHSFAWHLKHLDGSCLVTGAHPKAGTGHKMQRVSVVFSTLHCEGYTADLRYTACLLLWECSLAHWNLIHHFEKHERTVRRKIVAFWGTTRFPTFTMH